MSRWNGMLKNSKPYFAMISLQFGYAGMNIITKVSLNQGMSHYVLVVYRHVIATLVIAPFALFLERYIPININYTCLCLYIRISMHALRSIESMFTRDSDNICSNYRKARPKITFPICMQIFVLGLLGLVLSKLLSYVPTIFTEKAVIGK